MMRSFVRRFQRTTASYAASVPRLAPSVVRGRGGNGRPVKRIPSRPILAALCHNGITLWGIDPTTSPI
jgi:hypothetical protein